MIIKQYGVTKKNGSSFITTDFNQAWKVAEKNKTDLIQIQPERKVIAKPTWLKSGVDVQLYYTRGCKYIGLIEVNSHEEN